MRLRRAASAYKWPEATAEADLALLGELVGRVPDGREGLQIGAHLVRALSFVADSSMALRHLVRYDATQSDWLRELRSLRDNAEQLHFLASFFAFSDYLSEVVISQPQSLTRVLQGRGLNREKALAAYRAELAAYLDGASDPGVRACRLVLFKKRELLRIGIRDMRELAGTSELCRELSNLAESIVEVVYVDCYAEAIARFGAPRSEESDEVPGFCVYAMGKFGAGELNFSSDVDLIYVYDAEGSTDGVEGPVPGVRTRRTTNHEFFNWLGREIARRISEHTAEGFLYRVDLRLRPEGAAGPLARSRGGFVQYFASQAGMWEKIAWLKARRIAGCEKLARLFDPIVRQFVFGGNHAQELFPDISRLKKRIDFERLSEEGRDLDIKRGTGGIREIEFVVAGLQLVHAPQHPELMVRGTLEGLSILERLGMIEGETARIFRRAYYLYRRIEHTLQMMHESQTHRMPEPGLERERLAIRCGYIDYAAFEKELAGFRQFVRETFRRIIEDEEATGGLQLVDYLFGETAPPPEILAELRPCRLDDDAGFRALRRLAIGTGEFVPSVKGRDGFRRLLPRLLEELPRVAQPRQAVHHFDLLLRHARGFTWVYELCLSNPLILRLLLRVLGFGSMLGRLLVAHPEWLDEIFSSDGLKDRRTERAIRDFSLAKMDPDHETALRQLRRFKLLEGFLITTQEVLGITSAEEAAQRMSLLADHVLRMASGLSERALPGRPRWALLGLGGLGDRHVHYAGDLDLAVVVDDSPEAVDHGDTVFRDLIRDVTAMSPEGQLWKIDARLRPDGAGGPLVATAGRFRDYYAREAGLWEWQVLTKARVVAGDSAFGESVLAGLRAQYREAGAPAGLGPAIRAMKARIEEQVRLPRTALMDLKRGPGGVVDVEFVAQYLQLSRPAAADQLFPLTTLEVLSEAEAKGWLPKGDASFLRGHLEFLRLLQRGGRVMYETTSDYLPLDEEEQRTLVRGLADQLVGRVGTLESLEADCARAREILERTLAG